MAKPQPLGLPCPVQFESQQSNSSSIPRLAKRSCNSRLAKSAARPGSGNQSPPLPAKPIQGTTITNVSAIDAWAWEFWILSTPTKSRSYGKGQTKKNSGAFKLHRTSFYSGTTVLVTALIELLDRLRFFFKMSSTFLSTASNKAISSALIQ